MLDKGRMASCPWGRGVLMSGWDLWWCHKHNACHCKCQVSLDACSVSQFLSSKHSGFWNSWVENGVKWNNSVITSHLRLFLSSQLFTVDGRKDLSHTQGSNVLPTLQTPLVSYGAVVPSVSGSQLCTTVSHTPVLYCCIHITHSRLKNWY